MWNIGMSKVWFSLFYQHEPNVQVLSFIWEQSLWGETTIINFSLLTIRVSLGLRHWEVVQGPPLQRDPSGVQRSQHVRHRSSPQLYQRRGLQLCGSTGRVSPEGWEKWHFVCLLLLVERLLSDTGESLSSERGGGNWEGGNSNDVPNRLTD